MKTYWVPGVNNLGRFGRWDFVELTQVFKIEEEFGQKVEKLVGKSEAASVRSA